MGAGTRPAMPGAGERAVARSGSACLRPAGRTRVLGPGGGRGGLFAERGRDRRSRA
jgi:hypothetical protein